MVETRYSVEVHRQDGATVAILPVKNFSLVDQSRIARIEARHLSRVYGSKFYVEVWAVYDCEGCDYDRLYVFENGRCVCTAN